MLVKKAKALAAAAAVALPLSASADVTKIWPESIFLDYPLGVPLFPTVPGLEPNYISTTGDTTHVVVSTLFDLVAGNYSAGPVNTYRFNIDGMVNLIGTNADESDISGDGTIVAIEEGSGPLQRANADGTNQMAVLGVEVDYFSLDNAASKVAYVDGADLYISNIDGSNTIMLHDTNPDVLINIVQISGDGSKVLFATNPDFGANTPDPPELYVINADGTNQVQLTDGAGQGATASNNDMIRGASISDDGSIVVMVKTWDPGITKINSDGTGENKVFSLKAEFPKISGDGTTVAFLSDEQSSALGGASTTGLLTPYSFKLASPNAIFTHVPFGLGIQRNADVGWLDISQDGTWVVYTSPDDFFAGTQTRDFRDVYVYRSNGTSASSGGGSGSATGVVPGGIGTEANPNVTSLGRGTIALLALAFAAALRRRERARACRRP